MGGMSSKDMAVLLFLSIDIGTDWMFYQFNLRGNLFQSSFGGDTAAVFLSCLVVLILSTVCLILRLLVVDCTGMPESVASSEDDDHENPYWKADKWQDARSKRKKQFAVATLIAEDIPMLAFQSLYLHAVGFRGGGAALIVISPMITIINLVYTLSHVSQLLLKIEVINSHRFKQHTQLHPSKCTQCRETIWFYSHACKRCKLMVHRSCAASVIQACHAFGDHSREGSDSHSRSGKGFKRSQSAKGFGMNIPHTFNSEIICWPAFCEQCGQLAVGSIMRCDPCNVIVHHICAKAISNGCGIDNAKMATAMAGLGITAHSLSPY
jgi:hypothetical protein